MGYKAALDKSWDTLDTKGKTYIKFLSDEYEVDASDRKVVSLSCNVEAKDYYKILILHYLANESDVSTIENDKWISFREMDGGQAYFSAFRKRAIEPILRKYGDNPAGLFGRMTSLGAEKLEEGNAGISIRVFEKVKTGIVLWGKDEEFNADCNMLFNEGIKKIFSTEDVAVLGGIIASLV